MKLVGAWWVTNGSWSAAPFMIHTSLNLAFSSPLHYQDARYARIHASRATEKHPGRELYMPLGADTPLGTPVILVHEYSSPATIPRFPYADHPLN